MALDSNSDEEIHYSDFLAAMLNTQQIAIHDSLLKQGFQKFDVDSSGFITVDNMIDVMGSAYQAEEVKDLMKEADLVKDGRISYPEFVAYITDTPLNQNEQAAYLSHAAENERIADDIIWMKQGIEACGYVTEVGWAQSNRIKQGPNPHTAIKTTKNFRKHQGKCGPGCAVM